MKNILNRMLLITAVVLLFSGCSDGGKIGFLAARRLSAWKKSSVSNLKQIGCALEFYTQTTTGYLRPHGVLRSGESVQDDPSAAFEALRSQGHLTDHQVYVAPWDRDSAGSGDDRLTSRNTSYIYIYVDSQWSGNIPVAFEKPWRLPKGIDSINVLYGDGHVGTVNIPDVRNKSCREVLEILLEGQSSIPAETKAEWMKYADLADQYRD